MAASLHTVPSAMHLFSPHLLPPLPSRPLVHLPLKSFSVFSGTEKKKNVPSVLHDLPPKMVVVGFSVFIMNYFLLKKIQTYKNTETRATDIHTSHHPLLIIVNISSYPLHLCFLLNHFKIIYRYHGIRHV